MMVTMTMTLVDAITINRRGDQLARDEAVALIAMAEEAARRQPIDEDEYTAIMDLLDELMGRAPGTARDS